MAHFNLSRIKVLQFPENDVFQFPENSRFQSFENAIVWITYFSGNIISWKQNISISRKQEASLKNLANSWDKIFSNKWRVIIISWPCALFGSRFLINFRISSLVKWIVESNLCVSFERTEGRSLFVFKRTLFCKKMLDISAFSLKFLMNLLSCNNGGIQGIFFLFQNVF